MASSVSGRRAVGRHGTEERIAQTATAASVPGLLTDVSDSDQPSSSSGATSSASVGSGWKNVAPTHPGPTWVPTTGPISAT